MASVVLLVGAVSALQTRLSLSFAGAAAPTWSAGAATAAHYVGFLLGALAAAPLLRGCGARASFAGAASVATLAASVLGGAAGGLATAAIGFGALGASYGVLYAGIENRLNDALPDAVRGRWLSAYMTIWFLAGVTGQSIHAGGATAATVPIAASVIIASTIVFLAAPQTDRPRPAPRATAPRRTSIGLGHGAALVSGAAIGTFTGLAPDLAARAGEPARAAAVIVLIAFLAAAAGQIGVAALADRVGRRPMIAAQAFVASLACVLGVTITQQSFELEPALLFASAGLGAASWTLYASGAALANDGIDSTARPATTAGLVFAYGLGAAVSPVVAAGVVRAFGPSGLFLTLAAQSLALVIFALFNPYRQRKPI